MLPFTERPTTLGLRDYQINAQRRTVDEFLSAAGRWRLLGVLPTGTGKTVVFSTLTLDDVFAQYLETFPADQRKVLVIAHREELLTQAKDKYQKYNPTLNVQIEQADNWASPDADVVIASIQTLASRKGRRLARFEKKQFRVIVIDEAHHATAPTYVSVMQYFGFLPPDDFMPKVGKMGVEQALEWQRQRLEAWDGTGKPRRLLLGVTATPSRADRVGLELVFQKIAFEERMLDMIKQGYLCRLRALRIMSTVNLDPVHTKGGDFDEHELADAIDNVERNRVVVKAWMEHAFGRQTIAFTVNVQHALDLAEEFRAAGVRAEAIHGGSTNRKELLADFSAGKIQVLANCNILTEGFDEPNVQCIVHARPTKSSTLYTQMTGRGTRLHPGKKDCLILDIVDITTKHSLMSAPTLVGLPAEYDAKGKDLVEDVEKVEKLKEENPLLDTSSARSLDDLEARATEVDLFGPFKMPDIVENASLSWMQIGENFQIGFIGGAMNAEQTMRIKPNEFGSYDIMVEEFGREYRVATPEPDVHSAFAKAEAWIHQNVPMQVPNLTRAAKWRDKPISPGQKSLIEKLQSRLNLPPVDTGKLKSGQGADLIEFYKQKIKGRI